MSPDILKQGPQNWAAAGFDAQAFGVRNSKEVRWPEVLACAQELRSRYKRVAAIGYCFGGWASFRLGGSALNPSSDGSGNLIDCITVAHPTWLTKEEIDDINVPVQIVAPQLDMAFSAELKEHALRVIPTRGVQFDYQYFPGVVHGFSTRGDPKVDKERRSMLRCKNAQVSWMKEWVYEAKLV